MRPSKPRGTLPSPRRCAASRRRRPEPLVYAVVDPEAVVWAEAQDVYVCLHTDDGEVVVRQRLYQIHEQLQIHDRLGAGRFVRAHRSAVVNGARVARLVPGAQGRATLVMDDGAAVPVSRSCRADVNAMLARLGVRG
ncbi:MAG: LytTR family DNA-binding domain-containing protein [Bacteroidota bacterium]